MKKRMMITILVFVLAAVSMAGCSGEGKSSEPLLEGSVISKTVSKANEDSSFTEQSEEKKTSEPSAVKEVSEISEESKDTEVSQNKEESQTFESSITEPSESVSEISTVGFSGDVKLDHFGLTIEANSDDVSEGVVLHFKNGFTSDVKVTNDWVGSVMTVILTDTQGNEYGATFDWSSIAAGSDLALRNGRIRQDSEQTVRLVFKDISKGTKVKSITIKSVGTAGSNMNPVTIDNKA